MQTLDVIQGQRPSAPRSTENLPDCERSLSLYRKLFLVRQAENSIKEHYFEDEMKTPMHMSAGAEHISVGVCEALQDKDQVFGTYRSHALYLAKTMETDQFFGELYGRSSGCAQGIAGSMHLSLPEKGCMPCSAIVGSNISVATGAAFAQKATGKQNVVAAFFGEGALDEGSFWESLNLACLQKLPIVFVCEDNGLAVHTASARRQGYRSITNIVRNFDITVRQSLTTDVEEVHRLSEEAITQIRQGSGPWFLHFQYYRYLEHVGVCEDFKFGYRDPAEADSWKARDCLLVQRQRLLGVGFSAREIGDLETSVEAAIEESRCKAEGSPFSDGSNLQNMVFA